MLDNEAVIILGLDKDWGQSDLKLRYRKLAMRWHPDKPDGDEDKFKRIDEAYKHLSARAPAKKQANPSSVFKRPKRRVQRPLPKVTVTMAEAYTGGRFCKFTTTDIHCTHCDGLGYSGQACLYCPDFANGLMGGHCPYCNGTGFSDKCAACKGSGLQQMEILATFDLRPPMGDTSTTVSLLNPVMGIRAVLVEYEPEPGYSFHDGMLTAYVSVDLDDVIRGYEVDILGVKKLTVPPFQFTEFLVGNDRVYPTITVANKDKYTKLAGKDGAEESQSRGQSPDTGQQGA